MTSLKFVCIFLVFVLAAVLAFGKTAPTAPPIPASIRVNPNTVTISGISAGAAMAIQVQFAFSSSIRGVGIIAGIPYGCTEPVVDDIGAAFMCMDDPDTINVDVLMAGAKADSKLGLNDPWENILNQTVTLFSGTDDSVVAHGTMVLVDKMYSVLGQDPSKRLAFFNYSAEHAWITDFWGNKCDHLGTPYVNNCGLDFAGHMLQRDWAGMNMKFDPTRSTFNSSNMYEFDQTPYGASSLISLGTTGYIYVPPQCKDGSVTCNLHINFHGCEQYKNLIDDAYVSHTGINEYADANNIVVVYPQTIGSDLVPYNPKGCFDWWGYAGEGWTQKFGPQMKFVSNIMKGFGIV